MRAELFRSVSKMQEVESSSFDILTCPAVPRTEKELREAILEQTARVRKLKAKFEIEEATRELVCLKEEYRTVTGSEWSDLREEGPILLTTNKVRGREVLPEFREKVKQLRRENVIRYKKFIAFIIKYQYILSLQDCRHNPNNHRNPRQ